MFSFVDLTRVLRVNFQIVQNTLADIVDFVRKGDFSEKNEGQLRSIIQVLRNWQASYKAPEAASLISFVESEIERRRADAKHQELVSQQERLHQKHIEETKNLHRESSVEGKTQHKQSLHIERWILGFAIATFVVATLAYVHDLQNSHPKTESFAPPLPSTSAPAATPLVLTNAPQTNSVSKTNLPTPQATPQSDKTQPNPSH